MWAASQVAFSWSKAERHDGFRNVIDGVGQVEQRNTFQERHSSLRSIGVAGPRFVKHDLGDAEIEIAAFVIPPLVGDLLPRPLK